MIARPHDLLVGAAALTLVGPVTAHAELFGLIDTGQVAVSSDGGVTWEMRALLPVSDAVGLLALTASTDLVLVTRSGTVYASDDSGDDWAVTGSVTAADVVAVAARPDLSLLALTESGIVHHSDDGGTTFTPLGALIATDAVSLVAGPDAVHALTRTGLVFVSLDGGATWTAAGSVTTPDAVEIVRTSDVLHVVSATGEVWRSLDAGASWVAIGTLSQTHTSGLVREGDRLVAVTREGAIARSLDGVAWTWVGTINQVNVVALATDSPVVGIPESGNAAAPAALGAVYPNPWPTSASVLTLPVQLASPSAVALALYDVAGRRVASAPARVHAAGAFEIRWSPGRLASGVYVVEVQAGAKRLARRVVVVE